MIHGDTEKMGLFLAVYAWKSPIFLLSRKLRKSAKIVYNGLEIKNHITKERM